MPQPHHEQAEDRRGEYDDSHYYFDDQVPVGFFGQGGDCDYEIVEDGVGDVLAVEESEHYLKELQVEIRAGFVSSAAAAVRLPVSHVCLLKVSKGKIQRP